MSYENNIRNHPMHTAMARPVDDPEGVVMSYPTLKDRAMEHRIQQIRAQMEKRYVKAQNRKHRNTTNRPVSKAERKRRRP